MCTAGKAHLSGENSEPTLPWGVGAVCGREEWRLGVWAGGKVGGRSIGQLPALEGRLSTFAAVGINRPCLNVGMELALGG